MSPPKAVPSAVPFSTGNDNVPVLTEPQKGPYNAPTGKAEIPVVPRSDDQTEKTLPAQPMYGTAVSRGGPPDNGLGAPSVPNMNGVLFTSGPIDEHYSSESQAFNPYGKVNNPATRGMFTFVKNFQNHYRRSQDKTNTGFENTPDWNQQRTSVMRVTPPPHGIGYAPETAVPHQLPQQENTYKYPPTTGTDQYGSGVLNSDTFGAGQTAGGIGGNNYTPQPGPPSTNSITAVQQNPSGMPVWG
jgi:hypothetical protein